MEMTEVHSQEQTARPVQTNRWAFWGTGAGVLGIVANMVTDPILSLTDAEKQQGVVVAAAGVAWLAFRERLVVRWVGAVSLLAVHADITEGPCSDRNPSPRPQPTRHP